MKVKRHLLFILMAMLSLAANAADKGKCGENLTWTYNEGTQTLTISGTILFFFH